MGLQVRKDTTAEITNQIENLEKRIDKKFDEIGK